MDVPMQTHEDALPTHDPRLALTPPSPLPTRPQPGPTRPHPHRRVASPVACDHHCTLTCCPAPSLALPPVAYHRPIVCRPATTAALYVPLLPPYDRL